MNKFIKFFTIMALCSVSMISHNAESANKYTPRNPVEKVNKSLSVVEKKVRNAAVKVMTAGGHGSGTVVRYKDLTLVLTARHVTDGPLGMEYLVSNSDEQRTAVLIYQSKEHDIAVLVLKKEFYHVKPMTWKPTKSYDIGTDIVYSGHPSWHKLMSFQGRVVGYEDSAGSGTSLIVNTYGWFGCSGSGVYTTSGELIGILYGVDVQYIYGVQIQENMIWVAPIKNINIDKSLDAFCRGTIKNYKACR
jgi:S1-C subfamily serine protease|tara:strand:+ start:3639 stop:4379 length:741 start_codon:yes stop_codon:yes gene_type:complete